MDPLSGSYARSQSCREDRHREPSSLRASGHGMVAVMIYHYLISLIICRNEFKPAPKGGVAGSSQSQPGRKLRRAFTTDCEAACNDPVNSPAFATKRVQDLGNLNQLAQISKT